VDDQVNNATRKEIMDGQDSPYCKSTTVISQSLKLLSFIFLQIHHKTKDIIIFHYNDMSLPKDIHDEDGGEPIHGEEGGVIRSSSSLGAPVFFLLLFGLLVLGFSTSWE
jgi:hypothetical protein